jgi:hypothetical protein
MMHDTNYRNMYYEYKLSHGLNNHIAYDKCKDQSFRNKSNIS